MNCFTTERVDGKLLLRGKERILILDMSYTVPHVLLLTHIRWTLPARGPVCVHWPTSPRHRPRPHRPAGPGRSTAGKKRDTIVNHWDERVGSHCA